MHIVWHPDRQIHIYRSLTLFGMLPKNAKHASPAMLKEAFQAVSNTLSRLMQTLQKSTFQDAVEQQGRQGCSAAPVATLRLKGEPAAAPL